MIKIKRKNKKFAEVNSFICGFIIGLLVGAMLCINEYDKKLVKDTFRKIVSNTTIIYGE